MFRRYYPAVLFLVLAVTQVPAAEPAITRVLAEGQFMSDGRSGPLKTLDDYFPFTPPQSLEEWSKRRTALVEQVKVATGLWPMPEHSPPGSHSRQDRPWRIHGRKSLLLQPPGSLR